MVDSGVFYHSCCFHTYFVLTGTDLQWPSKNDGSDPEFQVACQLSVAVWMGLSPYAADWLRSTNEGEIAVFAETVSAVKLKLILKAMSGLAVLLKYSDLLKVY